MVSTSYCLVETWKCVFRLRKVLREGKHDWKVQSERVQGTPVLVCVVTVCRGWLGR